MTLEAVERLISAAEEEAPVVVLNAMPTRRLNLKVVYYGAPYVGKSANIPRLVVAGFTEPEPSNLN